MVYAKIQNGIVVNTQIMSATDPQDPNFTWVDVTNTQCTDGSGVQIGCTTSDNQTFNPPNIVVSVV